MMNVNNYSDKENETPAQILASINNVLKNANTCRLCLRVGNKFVNIFGNDGNNLASKILKYVSIKVSYVDGGPQKICKKCLHIIENWSMFKELCDNTNMIIQTYLSSTGSCSEVQNPQNKQVDESKKILCPAVPTQTDPKLEIPNSPPDIQLLERDSLLDKFCTYETTSFGNSNMSSILKGLETSKLNFAASSSGKKHVLKGVRTAAGFNDHSPIKGANSSIPNFHITEPTDAQLKDEIMLFADAADKTVNFDFIQRQERRYYPRGGENLKSNFANLGLEDHVIDLSNKNFSSLVSKNNEETQIAQQSLEITIFSFDFIQCQERGYYPPGGENLKSDFARLKDCPVDLSRKNFDSLVSKNNEETQIAQQSLEINIFDQFLDDRLKQDVPTNGIEKLCSDARDEISQYIHTETLPNELPSCNQMSENSGSAPDESLPEIIADEGAEINVKENAEQSQSLGPPYVCGICENVYTRFPALLRHDATEHTSMVKKHCCKTCSRLFLSEDRVQVHQQQQHKNKEFTCATCSGMFSSLKSLKLHQVRHISKYSCGSCSYVSTRKSDLQKHIQFKHERIGIQCQICEIVLFSQSSYNRHILTHYENNQCYKCSSCNMKFKERFDLKHHINAQHKLSSKVMCHKCGSVLKSKRSLSKHMKRHEPPLYECTTCHKCFKSKNEIQVHSVTHTKDKNFDCEVCKKKFSHKSSLIRHVYSHFIPDK